MVFVVIAFDGFSCDGLEHEGEQNFSKSDAPKLACCECTVKKEPQYCGWTVCLSCFAKSQYGLKRAHQFNGLKVRFCLLCAEMKELVYAVSYFCLFMHRKPILHCSPLQRQATWIV